jgi:branched-chain amino acid transport system permease protein
MTTAQLDTPVVSRRFWSGMTLFVCALLVAPMVASQLGGNYWVRVIDFALLYIMLALGLNIVVGYTGLLDMGFIAFYAVGAYLAALLASPHLLDVFPMLNSLVPGRPAHLVAGDYSARRAGGGRLRYRAGRADAEAARRLSGHRHPRLWRNYPHPDAQPRPSGQHHQRRKGISGVDSLNLFGLKFSGVYHWFGLKSRRCGCGTTC